MRKTKRIFNCGNFSLIAALFFTSSCVSIKKEKTNEYSKKTNSVFKTKYAQRSYLKAYNIVLKNLWNTNFEERDIQTTYGSAHIIISGPEKAAPLVLLHGMNASSTMWYPNVKEFSKIYRVYCIDFILEPGKSFSYGKIENTENIVKWYDEVFDQLKIDHFNIVGASRGGWLTMNLALHSKHRIDKIALLSPAQTFTWIKPKRQILTNILFTLFPRRPYLRSTMQTLTFNVDQISQLYFNQYFIAVAKTKTKPNKSLLSMIPFSEDELKSIKIPVLVLIGDHDIINNNDGIERAKKHIQTVETDVIKKSSHFLSFDRPEEVNKRVLQFLEKKYN